MGSECKLRICRVAAYNGIGGEARALQPAAASRSGVN